MKKVLGFSLLVIMVLVLTACGSKKTTLNSVDTNQDQVVNVSTTTSTVDKTTMVDCSASQDSFCFINRMNECLPVTIQMMGSDNSTKIVITILGVENEKCHFQRKINDVLNLDCFFPKGTMNQNTLDQTFGNEKGLQKVVDDACQEGW